MNSGFEYLLEVFVYINNLIENVYYIDVFLVDLFFYGLYVRVFWVFFDCRVKLRKNKVILNYFWFWIENCFNYVNDEVMIYN